MLNHYVKYYDYGEYDVARYDRLANRIAELYKRISTDRKNVTAEMCLMPPYNHFFIKKVIFNDPATIVFWFDGTKTVVKCKKGDFYDKEKGLAMAIAKRAFGNTGRYYEAFKKFIPDVATEKPWESWQPWESWKKSLPDEFLPEEESK